MVIQVNSEKISRQEDVIGANDQTIATLKEKLFVSKETLEKNVHTIRVLSAQLNEAQSSSFKTLLATNN